MPHLPQVTLSIELCSEWYIVFDVVRLVILTFLMRYFTLVDNDDVVDSDDDHIIGAVLVATSNVRGPVASQKVWGDNSGAGGEGEWCEQDARIKTAFFGDLKKTGCW